MLALAAVRERRAVAFPPALHPVFAVRERQQGGVQAQQAFAILGRLHLPGIDLTQGSPATQLLGSHVHDPTS